MVVVLMLVPLALSKLELLAPELALLTLKLVPLARPAPPALLCKPLALPLPTPFVEVCSDILCIKSLSLYSCCRLR